MPGTVKVRIMMARNLPIMDRVTMADAFVEVRVASTYFKTEVARRSLNPTWNSDWFKFELDDHELQEEALQIRVMDHDTYSTHDTIGRVYIDLNPLLVTDTNRTIHGWFPIYDTMNGIRGEINVVVKVDIFSDASRFRQSSIGVRFFYSSCIPTGYRLVSVLGFVEELVMNDDPEYQWIERLRTSRASNEARQRLFSKLSGELHRKMGLRVLELGGDSVIGYQLHFDLEGETGIVVRCIGTAACLVKLSTISSPPPSPLIRQKDLSASFDQSEPNTPWTPTVKEQEELTRAPPKLFRFHQVSIVSQKTVDFSEYPFLTISQPPAGFTLHYGSVVAAKSVKILDKVQNTEDPILRNTWWCELRQEVRSHMRAVGCTGVLGYREEAAYGEDVVVLSASGTAVLLNPSFEHAPPAGVSNKDIALLQTSLSANGPFSSARQRIHSGGSSGSSAPTRTKHLSLVERKTDKGKHLSVDINLANSLDQGSEKNDCCAGGNTGSLSSSPAPSTICSLCHVPPAQTQFSNAVSLSRCGVCQRASVPDVLFVTADLPEEMLVAGRPALIQAIVCHPKKETKGEACAKEISDILPFLEYDMHNMLMQKLKLKGMNALFGLKMRITISDNVIVVLGTGTGVYAPAMPAPQAPVVTKKCGDLDENELSHIQAELEEYMEKNREYHEIPPPEVSATPAPNGERAPIFEEGDMDSSSEGSAPVFMDCVDPSAPVVLLENDEVDVEDLPPFMEDILPPKEIILCSTERLPSEIQAPTCPGTSRSLETLVRVCRVPVIGESLANRDRLVAMMRSFHRATWFRLRKRLPCALTALDFQLSVTEDDEVQILATGMLQSGGPWSVPPSPMSLRDPGSGPDGDRASSEPPVVMVTEPEPPSAQGSVRSKGGRPTRTQMMRQNFSSSSLRLGMSNTSRSIDSPQRCLLTPLSFVPGATVEAYLGNLDFFFVRETTSVRGLGGVSGFIECCLSEVMAVVRAHTLSLGGNALLAFHFSEALAINSTPGRNSAQCLLNVCGDMARVVWEPDPCASPSPLTPQISFADEQNSTG